MNTAMKLEWCGHMRDYLELAAERGVPVTVRIRGEADVTRDQYGTVKRKTLSNAADVSTYALPLERSPDQRRLSAMGIGETCDVAIQTPVMGWSPVVDVTSPSALGKTWAALDLNRMTVEVDGEQYKVVDKGFPVRYGDRPIALSLALRRS